MSAEIFVYGDVETARKVIEGMNMVFNSSGWYSAEGADYNAGGFFTFGIMLTLWGSILAWFVHQRLNFGPVLLAFLIYVVMTVPRTDLIIQDVFSGDTAVVGDTPLGIAMVASLGSSVAKKMADQFDTVFSPVGSTSTMYQDGFASDLQLMLSLRKIIVTPKNVFFFSDLARYMANCAQLANPTVTYDSATGKMDYFLDHYDPAGGPITYQTDANPDGVGISCAMAANFLRGELNDYMNDVNDQASADLNAAIAAPTGLAYSSLLTKKYEFSDVAQSVQDGTGMSATEARSFMQDLLFHQWSVGAMGCGSAADELAFQECITSMTEAGETAKIDAAMQASIFQKIMVPLMNILTYLFYGLSPIVIVVAVATGLAGISIILKYALFGFWIQSWMPAALLINYVIMEQTRSAFQNFRWGVGQGAFNPVHFYDIVSTKLMVASEVMAATPMITLALLSAGAYAMSNVANGVGRSAASKADPSGAAPKLRKVDPLSEWSGVKHTNAGRNVGHNRPWVSGAGIGDPSAITEAYMGSGQMRKTLSTQVSAAKQRVAQLTQKRMAAVQAVGSRVSKQGIGASYTTTGGGTQTITGQDMHSVQSAILDRVGGSSRLSDAKKADLTAYFKGMAGLSAKTGKGKAGAERREQLQNQMTDDLANGGFGLDIGTKEAADIAHDWIEATSKEGSVDLQHVRSGSLTFGDAAQLTRAAATSENASFEQEARDVESYSDQLEEARTEQKRLEKTANTLNAYERTTGGNYAKMIYAGWQQGRPVQTGWNPDRFRGLTQAARQQGFIDAQQENALNHDFNEQYYRHLDAIQRQDPLLTPSQAESLAGFRTWLDFGSNGASVRFANLLNQEKGAMLQDYIGQGPGKDFLQTHGDRMAEGQAVRGPEKSGRAGQLLDSQGRGPGTLYADGQARTNDAMSRLPFPEKAFEDAQAPAFNRYVDGGNEAEGQYKYSGHHRKYNARKYAFNAQWENSYFAAAVEKAASMSDEFQEQVTQLRTSGASVGYAWDQLGAKFNKRLAAHESEVIAGLEKRLEEVNAQIPKASTEPTWFGLGDSEKTDLIQEKASLEQEIADAKAFRTELLNAAGDRPSPKEVLQQSYRHEANLMGLSGLGAKTYVATRMAAYENGNLPWTDQENTLQKLRPQLKDFSGPDANARHSEALRGWLLAHKISMERNGTPGVSAWQGYDKIYEVMSHGSEPMGATRDTPEEGWLFNPLSLSKPPTPTN